MRHSPPARVLIAASLALALAGSWVSSAISGPEVVTVREIDPVTVAPGDSTVIEVLVQVAPGYHVQANPASNAFLIPLELVFPDGETTLRTEALYPPAVPFRLEGTEDELLTYEGETTIRLVVAVPDSVPPSHHRLEGQLSYQACDDRRCLFPVSSKVVLEVLVPWAAPRPGAVDRR